MSFQIAIGPRIRKSPFYNSTVKAGVSHFTTYNHMYMPVSYGDPQAEYDRLMNGVDMRDVAGQRQVSLKGPDALELARMLTPRNLDNLTPGVGKYVPMTNSIGTLINDPVLLQVEDDEIWLSIADSDMKFWAEGVAVAKGLNVQVFEPDVSPLAIQGPKADDVVASLLGDWIRDVRYFGFSKTELDGIPLVVARSGWSKQGGFEFYLCDSSRGDELWDKVAEAGKPYGIGPGGPNYIERVESGLISVNADTDDWANPFEMGMGKFMDLDQDVDFIGKAALKIIKAEGIRRRFCGLIMDGEPFKSTNSHQCPVTMNGDYVGFASALAYSPRLEWNISTALISTEAADHGKDLLVDTEYGMRQAVVTSLPFRRENA
tara:strand:- start:4297 stop:5418 length:1122 start_codon:yes stop_codon:yes gene_type:complete